MKLPRWTVYPALATLAIFLVPAVPRPAKDPYRGAALEARARAPGPEPAEAAEAAADTVAPARAALPPAKHKRVVVLGIDGLDPELLQEVCARFPERMTSFRRLIDEGTLLPLGTSCPPQSPVAWSNFITGRDPGGHGIFDFIHRDLTLRTPITSTTTPVEEDEIALWGEWRFPLISGGESNRTGESFWRILAKKGVPADIWRMPANFPVEPAEGVSFSGMMTPALDSAYGEFTFYTSNPPVDSHITGGKIEPVREYDGEIQTRILGPANLFKKGAPTVSVPLTIYLDREANACALDTGEDVLVLSPGRWSEFTEVTFKFLPGWLAVPMDLASSGTGSVKGTVRFYLRHLVDDNGGPAFELYASPVNIDPLAPPGAAPVSSPADASAEVAESIGIYYTQGMPEDVAALKTEMLTDEEFMDQSELVHLEGVRMLDYALDRYCDKPDGGLLFFYFSGVDLCGHMMWRHFDEQHPDHDAAYAARDSSHWSGRPGSTWKDVIYDLYLHMDPVLGKVRERVGESATLIVMSDHGFAPYRRKFSLNTWLYENGYLVLKDGLDKELPADDPAHEDVYIFAAVDWSKTRAYGMGFNGLYLNLAGRELDNPKTPENEAGIVTAAEAPALLEEIRAKLLELEDLAWGGAQVVLRCDLASEVYAGERLRDAPDMVVGYNSGYGNSDPASLGRITHNVLEDNLGGTFNGSHLMAPEVVAGSLLTNAEVREGEHALEDLTVEILRQYGIEPGEGMRGHPVLK